MSDRSAPRPERGEIVSLTERMGALAAVRLCAVALLLAVALVAPRIVGATLRELALGSAAYLLVLLVQIGVGRGSASRTRWVLGTGLLLDGLYFTWVAYATGGTHSLLWFLIYAHVAAITLLGSYRTGLKVSAWYSLLYLVVAHAQAAQLFPVREADPSALPGGDAFAAVSMLRIGGLWFVAMVTAASSALIERELRAQKVDLERLSAMVRRLDRDMDPIEVPGVLLDAVCDEFGFSRGVVLASRQGDLRVLAHRGGSDAAPAEGTRDGVVERAWAERRSVLVRSLDPAEDPWLSALIPEARDVLVVPLVVEGGWRLGAMALEHRGRGHRLKRWVLAMVEQFAAHAALTLHNAWLHEQLEGQLDENARLQERLMSNNLELEMKVEERTQELTRSLLDLRSVDDQRRRLLGRLVGAQEEERARIAGDIHDDPIQKMVATSMRLQLFARKLTDPEDLEELGKLLGAVQTSIKGLRQLIFELRPSVLDEAGLAPALEELLDSLEADFEHHVDDRMHHVPPPEVRVVLYRLSQEALANVRKHAAATNVAVTLDEVDGGFLVQIADDGVGFSPLATKTERGHLGLTSLRERAELAGGWCRLHSLPGEGTTVEVWLPGEAPVKLPPLDPPIGELAGDLLVGAQEQTS